MNTMETKTAHDLEKKQRTDDVFTSGGVDFPGLLLSAPVLQGLESAGFKRPSPIQLKAIPLGRCGLDLIVQAKSGTGKTCVFAVVALEGLITEGSSTQVLVLAPTREIAVQIWEVINSIGSCIPNLKCYTFIGGLPLSEDKLKLRKCHIAVGTPGRVKQLIEEGALSTESIRLFVIDEADKLMEDNFQEIINWLYSSLPSNKQMLALSATYPESLAHHLLTYMRNPTFVRLNVTDPALLGIRQYQKLVPFHPLPQKVFETKSKALMAILSAVQFQQCLVFSNYQLRAQSLSELLNSRGWPSTYISGSQDQTDRLTAMAKLKMFKCRVLISTDLTSRGIDAENVNLVVNLDVPWDHETYLHRIGRAGRFGTYGAAISLVCLGKETADLKSIETKCKTCISQLPDPVPSDLARSSGFVNLDDYVSTEQLITQPQTDMIQLNSKDVSENESSTSSSHVDLNQHCTQMTNGASSSLQSDKELPKGLGSTLDNHTESQSSSQSIQHCKPDFLPTLKPQPAIGKSCSDSIPEIVEKDVKELSSVGDMIDMVQTEVQQTYTEAETLLDNMLTPGSKNSSPEHDFPSNVNPQISALPYGIERETHQEKSDKPGEGVETEMSSIDSNDQKDAKKINSCVEKPGKIFIPMLHVNNSGKKLVPPKYDALVTEYHAFINRSDNCEELADVSENSSESLDKFNLNCDNALAHVTQMVSYLAIERKKLAQSPEDTGASVGGSVVVSSEEVVPAQNVVPSEQMPAQTKQTLSPLSGVMECGNSDKVSVKSEPGVKYCGDSDKVSVKSASGVKNSGDSDKVSVKSEPGVKYCGDSDKVSVKSASGVKDSGDSDKVSVKSEPGVKDCGDSDKVSVKSDPGVKDCGDSDKVSVKSEQISEVTGACGDAGSLEDVQFCFAENMTLSPMKDKKKKGKLSTKQHSVADRELGMDYIKMLMAKKTKEEEQEEMAETSSSSSRETDESADSDLEEEEEEEYEEDEEWDEEEEYEEDWVQVDKKESIPSQIPGHTDVQYQQHYDQAYPHPQGYNYTNQGAYVGGTMYPPEYNYTQGAHMGGSAYPHTSMATPFPPALQPPGYPPAAMALPGMYPPGMPSNPGYIPVHLPGVNPQSVHGLWDHYAQMVQAQWTQQAAQYAAYCQQMYSQHMQQAELYRQSYLQQFPQQATDEPTTTTESSSDEI